MSSSQNAFVEAQYALRAQDYVTSAVHASGADLDQIAAELQGCRSARVLDLGCGGGHVSYRAAPLVAEVVACDVTEAMLEQVTRTAEQRGLANITVQRAAAESLPFESESFDIVLCRFTTHHWPDMDAGLRQARRVLKRAGRAIFIDSVAPATALLDSHLQAIELLRDISHVRNYSVAEWSAALARSGFAIETVTLRKLRMEFPTWIARTRTPETNSAAIRALQVSAPAMVQEHFAIDADGSWDLDVATFVVNAA